MIKSRSDYRSYIRADDEANGYKGISKYFNVIRKYMHALRFAEYAQNTGGYCFPWQSYV